MGNIVDGLFLLFLIAGIFTLVYFLIKGYLNEGWSRFALAWAIIFVYCSTLLTFSPLRGEGIVCFFSILIFVGAVIDYFVIMKNHQRILFCSVSIVICLGSTFVQLIDFF